MSERDDMAEQMYHLPSTPAPAQDPGHVALIRIDGAAQALDFLLELQREVERVWGREVDPRDPEAVSQYVREVVLCAEDELHEVLKEVHWKPWKDSRGIKDIEKYRGEMADVLHFILDLYLAAGMTGEQIVLDYLTKHYENLGRQQSDVYKAS